jgi:Tol biopolymer transport system component
MKEATFPALEGRYLGQKPPGMIPELFAPGVITTEFHEHSSPAFSPDGNEVYWSVFINFWGPQVILAMRQENGRWTEPQVASFCGRYGDGNPCFSPDGRKIFFESRRPVSEGEPYTGNTDIWVVERQGLGWSTPKHLGNAINSDRWERGPSVSNEGSLYFCSMREGGYGQMDIYRSTLRDEEYAEPENLGEVINTSGYESWPFIAPDESYLIFESDARDLMISFRKKDASWSAPKNLSKRMNFTDGQDRFPLLSNDGRYLFFVTNRWLGPRYFDRPLTLEEVKAKARSHSNGLGNVFWVDAKIIGELKPDTLK